MTSSDLPSLAIIIPAYNCADYIEGALRSCLNQTSAPSEIIVVNDGSKDNLAQVMRPFVESGAVSLINQENQGVSCARNNGIEASTAELVSFLDADDELLPHAVQVRQKAAQEFPEADVVFGDFWKSDLPGERYRMFQYLNAEDMFGNTLRGRVMGLSSSTESSERRIAADKFQAFLFARIAWQLGGVYWTGLGGFGPVFWSERIGNFGSDVLQTPKQLLPVANRFPLGFAGEARMKNTSSYTSAT